jgi:uncharacterized protein (DUF608 family)
MFNKLFPTDLPERQWFEFSARGFSNPVTGVIYRAASPIACGLPLGGIDTGCIDLETTGLLGYATIFNSLVPRRGPVNLPFLGLSVNRQTWVMTTLNISGRNDLTWNDLYTGKAYRGIKVASDIHYWGHYPVADVEFATDSPVSVGLRAWSPFIPGDVAASNTPGAVFEVFLRNTTDREQKGTFAFSFPGPSEEEAGTTKFARSQHNGKFSSFSVKSKQASYTLGVIEEEKIRFGGELGVNGEAWACIEDRLPYAAGQAGACAAVDFTLAPSQEKCLRFVLAWYAPVWMGGGTMTAGGNPYTHMYASRYKSSLEVARYLAKHHENLLRRIFAWQSIIYNEATLPPWLRDGLINILHLIPETSVWAQAKPPIGDWCKPEDGIFGLNESPRWCPQIECIPCSFYGNLPLVYLFPQLALSTLRTYKAYQYPEGNMPWVFGGATVESKPYEMALPSRGYAHKPQTTLDGQSYTEMVDKLWQRTGDKAILTEFYESVKKNTILTMNLRPGSGPAGIVSMPADNNAYDWYEFCDLFGIVPHIGGVHLVQLRMAKRMAEVMGDEEFAGQCDRWLRQGSEVMETHAWAGTHYMLFNELETGKSSDVILANQLDGEWVAAFHGVAGVFPPDRVQTTLNTIKETNIAMTPHGAAIFCKPQAQALEDKDWSPGYWGPRGVHPPGTFMLAMLYMYRDRREFGIDLARRCVQEIVNRGWYWDWPVALDSGVGPRVGFDYYQNLVFWSLPAALQGQDLTGPCRPGNLVDRILSAAKPER